MCRLCVALKTKTCVKNLFLERSSTRMRLLRELNQACLGLVIDHQSFLVFRDQFSSNDQQLI